MKNDKQKYLQMESNQSPTLVESSLY